ncbi:unnamed protein product, partial [Oppiella nova]
MSGYDSERFVRLAESEVQELSCGVFCVDQSWLNTSHTCPFDRKVLTTSGLSDPPRIATNMLSKLEITCDFKDNGCPVVVSLGQLSEHSLKCDYNLVKCYKCFQSIHKNREHDCLQTLLDLNIKLKLERDNLLDTIQHMSTDNGLPLPFHFMNTLQPNVERKPAFPPLPKTSHIMEVTEYEAIVMCRNQSVVIQVAENNMNEEMTGMAMNIISQQIHGYSSLALICEKIVHKMNDTFGREWHSSADFRSGSKSYTEFKSQFDIKIQFGLLYLH